MPRILYIPDGDWGCGEGIQYGCGWVGDNTTDYCTECDFIGDIDDFCPNCNEEYNGDQQTCPDCHEEASVRETSSEYEGVNAWVNGEYLVENPYDIEKGRDYEIWEAAWLWADSQYMPKEG